MNLETTFYTIGIIYMSMMMLVTVAFVFYALYLIRKFEQMQKNLEAKIAGLVTPTTILGLGTVVFKNIFGLFRRRR